MPLTPSEIVSTARPSATGSSESTPTTPNDSWREVVVGASDLGGIGSGLEEVSREVWDTDEACREEFDAEVLLADGLWVGSSLPEERCSFSGDGPLTKGSEVGLETEGEIRWFDSTSELVPGDDPRQVSEMASDGEVVAWFETESVDLYVDDWRLFAAEIESGRTWLVARSEEINGAERGLPALIYPTPTISEGRIYWDTTLPRAAGVQPAALGASSRDYVAGVVSRAVDGSGQIVVEATGASDPRTTDRGVLVSMWHSAEDGAATRSGIGMLEDGKAVTIFEFENSDPEAEAGDGAIGDGVGEVVAAGSHAAFTVAGNVHVLDLATETVTVYSTDSWWHAPVTDETPLAIDAIQMSENYLVWTVGQANAGDGDSPVPLVILELATGEVRGMFMPVNSSYLRHGGDLFAFSTFVPEGASYMVRWSED